MFSCKWNQKIEGSRQKAEGSNRRFFFCFCLLLTACCFFAAELAQFLFRFLVELAVGVILDELREVAARFLTILVGRNFWIGRLLALALREIKITHAGEPERLVNPREIRIARDDLFTTRERCNVS